MHSDAPVFLKAAEWPECDRFAWAKACASGGYFDEDGLAARWSPQTAKRCETEYGRFLLYLRRCGVLREVRRVGERIAREDDLRGYIEWLRSELAPQSVVAALGHVAQVVRAMDPEADRALLLRAHRRLRRSAKPVRNIDAELLPPDELWALGIAMMDEAEERRTTKKGNGAVLYRDGLIIAFLSVCPLRRRNAHALREDRHVQIEAGSRRVSIPAEEMKTRSRDLDVTLPEKLIERLRRYWDHFRRLLAWRPGTDDTALWLTTRGTAMSDNTMSDRIVRIMLARKGRRFTSHMFRHSAATFIADIVPDQALMAVGVLGHTQFDTTQKAYIRGQQTRALRNYQSEIAAIIMRGKSDIGESEQHGST